MRHAAIAILLCVLATGFAFAQRTDLSGLKFCIDPGHGGHNPANDRYVVPEPGTEFWESESNFQKAMRLDTLLTARGATVILTRYTNDYPNDSDEPSLTARWSLANANNVNWFHSIHSNAFNESSNYTLVLLRENVATRQALFPEALVMSNIISPAINAKLRTTASYVALDYTFYSGSMQLGVLSGLTMPGELSEGSFHDVKPETRRLMNNSYRKMEAYALRNSFLQFFGVPADTLGIIAGIQTNLATSSPVNYTQVRLRPLDRVVTGDSYNNGFYMFDKLPAGTYTVRFETPGYTADSVQVTLGVGGTSFVDRSLVSQANPTVVLASPVNNDTTVIVNKAISLSFTKPMDTASVRAAFSISPVVAGTIGWNPTNATMTFTPSSYLAPWVTYQVRVDTMARAANGQAFDGNGDGITGDPYVLTFRTKYVDIFPPAVVSASPWNLVTLPTPTPVVNITFDEPVNQSTVNTSNFLVQLVGSTLQAKNVEYAEANGQGGVTLYMTNGVNAGASYKVRVGSISDLLGNVMPSTAFPLWQYAITPGVYTTAVLDSVEPGTTGFGSPQTAADHAGIDALVVAPTTSRGVGIVGGNRGSLAVSGVWDTTAGVWALRIPLDTASAGGRVYFRKAGTILRAYVHGDGGKSQVRFCVADSVDLFPDGPAAHREVSSWFTVDWVGWRALHWDLDLDSVGTGSGNGLLEGLMRFAGWEYRYVPGFSKRAMQSYLDQVEVIQRGTTGVEGGQYTGAASYALLPAYPNPFNPATVVSCQLPVASHVRLAVYDMLGREVALLINSVMEAGSHKVPFDGAGLASGTYVIRMTAQGLAGGGQFVAAEKVVLVR
jgi:N-acetylmuramoyl-L-alanine amidase